MQFNHKIPLLTWLRWTFFMIFLLIILFWQCKFFFPSLHLFTKFFFTHNSCSKSLGKTCNSPDRFVFWLIRFVIDEKKLKLKFWWNFSQRTGSFLGLNGSTSNWRLKGKLMRKFSFSFSCRFAQCEYTTGRLWCVFYASFLFFRRRRKLLGSFSMNLCDFELFENIYCTIIGGLFNESS